MSMREVVRGNGPPRATPTGRKHQRATEHALGMEQDRSVGKVGKSVERHEERVPRTRQNFSWRQISVLEQVFELGPVPSPVRPPSAPLPIRTIALPPASLS